MRAATADPPRALATALPPLAQTPGGTVHVARTIAEVEALRDAWATLPWADLEADVDFFLTVARLRDLRPHVLVVVRDDAVVAMAMGRIERRDPGARIGGRGLPAPKLRCVTIVHGGVAAQDDAALDSLVAGLWATVRSGAADAVYLHKAAVGGPLARACERGWRTALRPATAPPTGHWHLRLAATFEDYLATLSSRTRRSVRKGARVLEGEHGDRIALRRYGADGPADRAALVADLEAVAARSYQRGLGGGFTASEEMLALLDLGLEQRRVRAWVLTLDGAPVAYELGHGFSITFFGAATGFVPELRDLRVGTYVQMRMVEDLCAVDGIDTIDFGYGDAEYKSSFAHDRTEDADITLLGPRGRALAAGAMLALAGAADGAARRALGQGRAMAWLRRRRRARAARRAA
jgi:Acetyltransferase (GNAT) domain